MNRSFVLVLLIIAVPCFGSSGKPFIDSYEKILLKLEKKKQVADKKGQGLLFDRMLSKAHLTLEKLQKTKKCSENHQNLIMEIEKILLILKELTYIPTPKGTVIEEKLRTKYYIQPTFFVSVPSSPDKYRNLYGLIQKSPKIMS